MSQISSRHLEHAVRAISRLPGIGRKSALRIALFLLKQKDGVLPEILDSLHNLRHHVRHCRHCHNLADGELCGVCTDPTRQRHLVCVVESERDVMAIEDTGQYHGLYHVLGGVISPIEGIGPQDLRIDTLVERLRSGEIKELIMAVSPTIEGETTIFYLSKLIREYPVRLTVIARGVAFGGELEYTDGLTLGRSILARTNFELAANA